MSVTQSRSWCSTCQEHTLHERHLFGFGWGCLLTIFTMGLFIPIWLLISLCETLSNPPRCQKCGQGHPSTVQAIALGFMLLVLGCVAFGYFARKTDSPGQSKPETTEVPIAAPIPPAQPKTRAQERREEALWDMALADGIPPELPAPPEEEEDVAPSPPPPPPAAAHPAGDTEGLNKLQELRDRFRRERQEKQAASDDAAHATALLATGRNLEKIGKAAAALKSYRELLAKYPNSAEAKAAGERIKALGAGGMP